MASVAITRRRQTPSAGAARRRSARRDDARTAAARRAAATPSPAASRGSASSPIARAVGRASRRRAASLRAARERGYAAKPRPRRTSPRSPARRDVGGLQHRRVARHSRQPSSVALVGGNVDLAHPRVETREHARAAALAQRRLRERRERRHWHDGKIGAERQPLRDAAGDAHAGERRRARRRTRCRRDRAAPSGVREHGVDRRQHALRVRLRPHAPSCTCQSWPSPAATGTTRSTCRARGYASAILPIRVVRTPAPRVQSATAYVRCHRRLAIAATTIIVDDRVARPGGPRHRARRRQGRLRRRRAAGRARRDRRRQAQADVTSSRARDDGLNAQARRASSRAARISASAAAARCSTPTPALQVAAKQRALEDALARIGRVRPERCCRRSTARRGATGIARGFRSGTCAKKGGVLVGFHERKSSYVADMRECHVLPRKIVRPAGAAARADRVGCRSATGCRRSKLRWASDSRRTAGRRIPAGLRARVAHSRAARARRRGDARRRSPTRTASTSGCSPAARHRRAVPPATRRSPTRCPNSTSRCRSRPPSSRRSTPASIACWCGARWRSSTRSRASASPTSSAASATSRCRSRGAAPRSSASKATPRWCAARRRTPRATASPTSASFRRRQPVRGDARKPSKRSVRSTSALVDPPREGAIELVEGAAAPRRRARAGATRVCLVQPGDAGARRRGARARTRLSPRGGGRGQHVSAHGARRIDRAVRPLTSRPRVPPGRP